MTVKATVMFAKATKKQLKARIALIGPAGSGKSYTAMRLAYALAGPEAKVAAIDTEHRSLSKYVGEQPDGKPWEFDVLELESFSADNYIAGIHAAEDAGYNVLVIDSLSHAWAGKDGMLEYVDQTAKKLAIKSGGRENNFAAWREATPKHNELVETMLASKLHLIVTMRVKMEYIQEKDERTGKTAIRKIGLQPVQRDGLEYEFDVIADMDTGNNLVVSKTRCSSLTGKIFVKPGPDMAQAMLQWLSSGAPVEERKESVTTEPETKARETGQKPGDGEGQPETKSTEPKQPLPPPKAKPSGPVSHPADWTKQEKYIKGTHALINQCAEQYGFVHDPKEAHNVLYETIKDEQFKIKHLAEFKGTPEELRGGIELWFKLAAGVRETAEEEQEQADERRDNA